MLGPYSIRRAQPALGVHALVAALALPGAAQTSASFPDLPGQEQSPPPAPVPAKPPPPAATAPTAAPQPVAPPPAYPAPGYGYPAPEAVPPQPADDPGYADAGYGGFFPPVLPYREEVPPPDGYRLERRRSTELITAGALVLAAGYAVGFGVAAAHGFDKANGWLAVPLIGPWVALGMREAPCNIDDVQVREDAEGCVDAALDEAALIAAIAVDGLVQVTGAGLLLGGALSSKPQWVREDVAGWRVAPQRVGRSGYGLGMLGRF